MTVDRQQIRRDETPAVLLIRNALRSAMCGAEGRDLAIAHFDALLTELEETERERDKARDELDRSPGTVELRILEARLANVPPLIEAAASVAQTHHGQWRWRVTSNGNEHIPKAKLERLRAALAAYENNGGSG